ncbi:HET-domain-containing protein [Leucogyrophana mollusca]|uniref:HET-domain-containing protein n=1 Tax=Leucogyrophana mollusca TaxID=85980 RepID=A0ACB8BCU6_9AGAM|nr:HET-domain-containing protein [Leucogyrophana mollusca]
MKIMGRSDVKRHYQSVIERIADKGISMPDCPWECPAENREDRIRGLVRGKVKYAILSHRWLDEGEPTFQEMSRGELGKGPGYEKLGAFCEKARAFGCDFVWSDTCCINKTSSAELDEAIRAMFRWYRNAHVCIAYLSDSSTIADFKNEVWFRRGWTLQELLAPRRMKFFGKGWIPLSPECDDKNPKKTLQQTLFGIGVENPILNAISRLTKIPLNDLTDFTPGPNRVREKMSWASNRRTTRIEDIAYSLVGMFDVSLMVAYGEGNMAFYRLLEAIIQRSNGSDVFYWEGTPSPYNVALPGSPASYPSHTFMEDHASPIAVTASKHDKTYPVGDQSFAFTNRGLRLDVLLVQVKYVRQDPLENGRVKLTVKHRGFGDISVVVIPRNFAELANLMNQSYAVGIIDYWNKGQKGFIDKCRIHTAFLLCRHGQSSWTKVRTERVFQVRPLKVWRDRPTTLYL